MSEAEVEILACKVETSDGDLQVQLAIPRRPIRLAELAQLIVPLDQALVELGSQRAFRRGERVSCRAGCAACCRQLVALSPPEAFWLAERIATRPSEEKALVEARAEVAAATFERSWIGYAVRHHLAEDERRARELALAYHRLGIACPFLENERCSVYEARPSVCREYVVTTPAENCAVLGNAPVRRVPLAVQVSEALSEVSAEVLGTPAERITLPTALAWAGAHVEQGQRLFPARPLLESFVRRL